MAHPPPTSLGFAGLIELIDILRGPDGCAWDHAQSLETMRGYLLEEAYELDAAIGAPRVAGGPDPVAEELGDLLFNVLMMVHIGKQAGRFDLDAVAQRITDKMVARHPHVFAADSGGGPRRGDWARARADRASGRGLLDGVPRGGPALVVAAAQGAKARTVGFDWSDAGGVLAKLDEELAELRDAVQQGDPQAVHHELGDLLMAAASLGRHTGVDAEAALRAGNQRFADRFACMEREADAQGRALHDMDAESLDAAWVRAKGSEARHARGETQ